MAGHYSMQQARAKQGMLVEKRCSGTVPHLVSRDFCVRREAGHHLCCHQSLALAHMVLPEQELAVEVAGFDGV
jgi:hypothetical protein